MTQKSSSYILLILSMLAWGSVYPISKFLMAEINPLMMAFLRYSISVAALTPFFIVEIGRSGKRPGLKSIPVFFLAGLAGVSVFAYFLFVGVNLSTATNGSIIINTQPVFTAVLAPLLLREKLTGIQLLGIIAGFAGMFLVVTGGNLHSLTSGSSLLEGNLLLVAGSISMCFYGILLKNSIKKFGGIIPTWYSMFLGTIVLLVMTAFTGSFSGFNLSGTPFFEKGMIVYLGTIGTAFAYLFFNLSLKRTEVVVATSFKFLIPVSGILLSVIFIGERPAVSVYAGVIIVIFSVFLIQRKEVVLPGRNGKTQS